MTIVWIDWFFSQCNAYSNDVIDLTKEKTEVAREHVQAARSQVEMMKYQCKLSAIEHAIKVGINVERLRPCVETTLEDLFPGVMEPSARRKTLSETIVLLDKDEGVTGEEADDDTVKQTRLSSPINEASLPCAAGKNCKEPNAPVTDAEFKCAVCKRLSHQHCLGDICDVGYLCLPCALEWQEDWKLAMMYPSWVTGMLVTWQWTEERSKIGYGCSLGSWVTGRLAMGDGWKDWRFY
jgi:hypothetical protein